MRYVNCFVVLFVLPFCPVQRRAKALEPNEILVIVNEDIEQSVKLGRYYCRRRSVPEENILALSLGETLTDAISRDEYDKRIAGPARERLAGISGFRIRCLLTTYGVPYRVGGRGPLRDRQDKLERLRAATRRYEQELENLQQSSTGNYRQAEIKKTLARIQGEIGRIAGEETDASVDSELSLVRFGDYELYRWRPNQFNKNNKYPADLILTVMVSRLDGPTPAIARGLVDKSITAEKAGLTGAAYIDSRGISNDKNPLSMGHFDQSLRDLAMLLRFRTELEVKEERTEKLFEPDSCPQTAIYCGWYSLKRYVDAFDFVTGAVGFHIASLEAVNLRDADSTEWCPAMLTRGITATLGAVAEPYLHAFPKPDEFFLELIEGRCLVEAFYRTKPFCSWRMVLIGDPLYTPFKDSVSGK